MLTLIGGICKLMELHCSGCLFTSHYFWHGFLPSDTEPHFARPLLVILVLGKPQSTKKKIVLCEWICFEQHPIPPVSFRQQELFRTGPSGCGPANDWRPSSSTHSTLHLNENWMCSRQWKTAKMPKTFWYAEPPPLFFKGASTFLAVSYMEGNFVRWITPNDISWIHLNVSPRNELCA